MTQTLELAQSYRCCEQIARTKARNFYYGFMLLPRERRRALSVMYAFFRACDDYSDDAGTLDDKRRALDEWRRKLQACYDNDGDAARLGPIFPAFSDAVRRFNIPARYFHDLLDGTLMDLDTFRYESFDDLYRYCYRVASTVGLVCVHIFGFDGSPEALKMAEWCGIAFQLTNIMRDVEEDVRLGRIYLPQEDLRRFGLSSDDLASCPRGDGFRQLMAFQATRAHDFYDRSAPLLNHILVESRAGFAAMVMIYRNLLRKIERADFAVYGRRLKLSKSEKMIVLARAFFLRGGRVLNAASAKPVTTPQCQAEAEGRTEPL